MPSVLLRCLGLLYPGWGFMAKEKCEKRQEDSDCFKGHGGWKTFLSLIRGKGWS